MLRWISPLVLIFLFLSSTAQTKNYIHYHQAIMKAESLILDSNYAAAVKTYDSIFQKQIYIFPEHAYTATQTAIQVKDSEKAFQFMELCVRGGLELNEVYKDSLLIQLSRLNEWQYLADKYQTLHLEYQKGINIELREKLIAICNKDMACRNKAELAKAAQRILVPFYRRKWRNTVKNLVENELFPLMKQHGYPGKKLIGVINDSLLVSPPSSRYSPQITNEPVAILLQHYYSFKHKKYFDIRDFKNNIELGNIHPRVYAMLIQFMSSYTDKQVENRYRQGANARTQKTESINNNRNSIGLESLELLKRKRLRGRKVCKQIQQKKHNHIRLWWWCG